MTVCVDCSPLLVHSSGVKSYLHHWLLALRALPEGNTIRAFPFYRPRLDLNHIHSSPADRARIALLLALNHGRLPLTDLIAGSADVFHVSNLLRQLPRSPRLTATVHDLSTSLLPETHTDANVRADRQFSELVLRRAHGLIAVSHHTRDDAVRVLNLHPEKIQVIHHGVPDSFFHVSPEQAGAAKDRYRLQRPYCLALGTVEPRKNIDRTLDAWLGMNASIRESHQLVVAGPPGWHAEKTLARLADLPAGIRYLGYLPETFLAGLVAGAIALVFPSLYEGFGFPIAQAIAAGVPVLTSNVSSMPEVAGDAAILVDPLSTASIRLALETLLLSPSRREALSHAARLRAPHFRMERCVRESWDFFRRVGGL